MTMMLMGRLMESTLSLSVSSWGRGSGRGRSGTGGDVAAPAEDDRAGAADGDRARAAADLRSAVHGAGFLVRELGERLDLLPQVLLRRLLHGSAPFRPTPWSNVEAVPAREGDAP